MVSQILPALRDTISHRPCRLRADKAEDAVAHGLELVALHRIVDNRMTGSVAAEVLGRSPGAAGKS